MHPIVKYLACACAGALLFACAGIGPRGALPAQLAGSPDNAYVLGRQQHLANRHAAAIVSYHAALRLDPRHVNATNGLATLYAEQGNFPKAIALWRELTDVPGAPSVPGVAFLYSNLGYAYLLNGNYQQAIVALERACVLDPLNYRAWRHLGRALEKLGQAERAQLMFKQASTFEQHDFKADYALIKRGAAGALDVAAASVSGGWAATEVHQSANGMFELRRTPAPAAAAHDKPDPAKPVAAAGNDIPRLEIRNGNGATGMAHLLARKMDDASLRVVRLSNEKRFNVERTRIEYQSGFREAAIRLAERFDNATVTEVESCNNADMRLVIGRDLMRSKVEARRLIKATLSRVASVG